MDVEAFVSSGKELALEQELQGDVIVLDSSFNPPHNGHIEMARLGLEQFPGSSVLLLIATGNADKPVASVAEMQHRMNMMALARSSIEAKQVVLGLTRQAIFTPKLQVLRAQCPKASFILVLGADTFVRVLQQKYYTEPIDQVLRQYHELTRFLVVERGTTELSKDLNTKGPPGLFKFVGATAATEGVSSSLIRESCAAKRDISQYVPRDIQNYIKKEQLYD